MRLFLQDCMILVKVGCPEVVRGAVKASRRLGFQVLLFAIFGFFGDTSTSITAVVGGFLGRSWFDGLGSELVMSSIGISLCMMLARLARRSSCIVVNSHNKFTSPPEQTA